MKRKLCLVLIIMIIAGFALPAFGNDAAQPLIIDVRTAPEWNSGHLDGAIRSPMIRSVKELATLSRINRRGYIYIVEPDIGRKLLRKPWRDWDTRMSSIWDHLKMPRRP